MRRKTRGGRRAGLAVAAVCGAACAAVSLPAAGAGAQERAAGSGGASGAARGFERVSVTADGAQGERASGGATLSADGRLVAFSSLAPGLGGNGRAARSYVKDTRTGELTPLGGANGYPAPRTAHLSADGTTAAYMEVNSHYYPEGYVRDLRTGETEQVSTTEVPGKGRDITALSSDGRYALVHNTPSHPSEPSAVYLLDRERDTAQVVSREQGDATYNMRDGRFSADGNVVAYRAQYRGTGPADTDDVLALDRRTGRRSQVDVTYDGSAADGPSRPVAVSGAGRHVLFTSEATNVTPGAGSGSYVRDLERGTTRRLAEVEGAKDTTAKALSADGRRVLLSAGTGAGTALFVRDLDSGAERQVTPPAESAGATESAFAADGTLAFTSTDGALVPGDTNGEADVFVHRAP